jgi:hypothetical protein
MANFNELRKMDVGDAFKSVFSRKKNADVAAAEAPAGEQETTDLSHFGEQGYQRALPGVNILPEATIQRRENRQLIRRFVAIGAAIAVVSVGCFGGSLALGYFHKKALETIEDQNANLTTKVNQLTPYKNAETSLDTARTAAGGALKNDLDVARLLTDLNSVANKYGVSYTQINMALNSGGAAASATGQVGSGTASSGCFNPDPFNAPTNIGCLTLSGTAASQARATAYFNQFKNQTGFLNGFISGLTTDGSKATFNGTIAFDGNFYSNKYTDLSKSVSQSLSDSATQNQTAGVVATLKRSYGSVLNSVDSTRLNALPLQVCQAASTNQTNVGIYQQLLATTVGKPVSTTDTTGIVRTIVNASCATQASKLTFLGTTTNATPSSTPTPTSSATPNVSSSSTAGTN